MGLSNDLISQFAKITNDTKVKQTESTIYGTVSILDGRPWVKFDGSDRLTPADTTAAVADGERVMVTVKNHTATITGNVSSPAARNKDVSELSGKIDEFDTVIADTVKAETAHIETAIITKLDGKYATFEGLDAKYASITSLEAAEADIDTLQANEIVINEKLTARDAEIDQLKANSLTVEVADAKYATIENLNGTNARFNNLESTYGEFKVATVGRLDAIEADIADLDVEKLDAKYATVTRLQAAEAEIDTLQANSLTADDLQALEANIANLQANKLSAKDADLKYATIEVLQSDYITAAEIAATYITASAVAANYAKISTLESDYIKTTDLEANYITAAMINSKYAEIDLANVDIASIGTVLANIGLITSAIIVDGHVTGYLDSVEVNANNITAGTLTVDRLIISGSDKSIIYAINNAGELTSTETDTIDGDVITKRTIAADHIIAGAITANEIHSSAVTADKLATNAVTADKIAANAITSGKIAANAITADKIAADAVTADKIKVVDLKALEATIGTFNIGDKSIYSGTKSTVSNTSRGIYMDTDGQLNFGDANNYLKFYKDANNVYKLDIAAESLTFGASGTRIEDAFEEVQNSIDDVQANANSTNSASGNTPIIINDSADGKVIDLKVYGKTTQERKPGKNILNNELNIEHFSSGTQVTATMQSDKTVLLKGTSSTVPTQYHIGYVQCKANQTYILSGCPDMGGANCRLWMELNDSMFGDSDYGSGVTFTAPNYDAEIEVRITIGANITFNNHVLKPMVRLASETDATYEPYELSPTPDNPEPLVSIGDSGSFNVDVYGKNLLDISGFSSRIAYLGGKLNGVSISVSSDGLITASGTATGSGGRLTSDSLITLPKGKYRMVVLDTNGNIVSRRLAGVYLSNIANTNSTIVDNREFELEQTTTYRFGINTYTGDTYDQRFYVMVCAADSDYTTYEPYKPKQTISFPYHLRGVGDVKDEIDFERGVYIQRVKKFDLSTVTYWIRDNNWDNNTAFYRHDLIGDALPIDDYVTQAKILCNRLDVSTPSDIAWNKVNAIGLGGGTCIYVSVDGATTGADLANYFATNETYFYYPLATPIEIPLTEQVLKAYANLRTYEPNTTFMVDGSPEMYVEYFKNTEDGKKLAKNADALKLSADNAQNAAKDAQSTANNAVDKVNNLQVGGRNYFSTKTQKAFDSDGTFRLEDYRNVGSFSQLFNLTVPMSTFVGKECVLSFDIISPNGETPLQVYNDNYNPRYMMTVTGIKSPISTSWTSQKLKVTVTDRGSSYDTDQSNKIEIYCSGKMGCKIRNVKFEIGNKATDWTPAPEDIDQNITNAVNNVQVGGRNYIALSKLQSYTPYNTVPTYTGTTITTTCNSANTSRYFSLSIAGFTPVEGEIYTLSGFIKVNGEIPSDNFVYGRPTTYGDESSLISDKYDATTGYFEKTQKYSGTWILHSFSTHVSGSAEVITFEKLKFEKGNKATDWTPAPEDVDVGISNAAKTATNHMNFDSTNGLVISQDATANAGNVQIKSDGFRIRNGTTVNASFLGNTITLGQNSSSSSINLCGDKGTIKINENQFGRDALTIMAEDVELYSDVSTSMICKPGVTSGGYSSTFSYCHTNYETFTLPNPITGSNITFSYPVARIGTYGINGSDKPVESLLEAGIGNVVIGGRSGSTDSMLGVSGTDGIQAYATGTPIKLAVYDSEIDPYIEVEPRTDTRGTRIYMAARNITLDPLDEVRVDGNMYYRKNSVDYKAFYAAGDSFVVNGVVCGVINDYGDTFEFAIPLSKPIIGSPAISVTRGYGVIVKQNGKFLYGSSSNAWNTNISSLTPMRFDDNTIHLKVKMSNYTNAATNCECGVAYHLYVTLS